MRSLKPPVGFKMAERELEGKDGQGVGENGWLRIANGKGRERQREGKGKGKGKVHATYIHVYWYSSPPLPQNISRLVRLAPLCHRLYRQIVSDQAAVGFRVHKEIHLVMSYPVKVTHEGVNSCDFNSFLWQVIPTIHNSNIEIQSRITFTVYFSGLEYKFLQQSENLSPMGLPKCLVPS